MNNNNDNNNKQMGYTPLHQASQQGHVLIINTLLTHKAPADSLTSVYGCLCGLFGY